MFINKGAMFGLDARIALAIFGALSVISGAALYSAIQSAKTERYRQGFVNIEKAMIQYFLNVGSQLPIISSNSSEIGNLTVNHENAKGWKGPYIDFDSSYITSVSIKTPFTNSVESTSRIDSYLHQVSDWADENANLIPERCIIDSYDCTEYLAWYITSDSKRLNLFTSLDNLIDSGDGSLTGKVRHLVVVDRIFYQTSMMRRKLS